MPPKVIPLRIRPDLHSALSAYAKDNFLSINAVVVQAVVAYIRFNTATSVKLRAEADAAAEAAAEKAKARAAWIEQSDEEYIRNRRKELLEEEAEMAELRRRAAKATPVKLEPDPIVGGEWMTLEE